MYVHVQLWWVDLVARTPSPVTGKLYAYSSTVREYIMSNDGSPLSSHGEDLWIHLALVGRTAEPPVILLDPVLQTPKAQQPHEEVAATDNYHTPRR